MFGFYFIVMAIRRTRQVLFALIVTGLVALFVNWSLYLYVPYHVTWNIQEWTSLNGLVRRSARYMGTKQNVFRAPLRTKRISLYTTLAFKKTWYDQKPADLINYTTKANCPIKECTFSYDSTDVLSYDALVFHFLDIHHVAGNRSVLLDVINRRRRENQIWVFFIHEPPYHFTIFPFTDMGGYFNWTMSYTRSSEVMLTYFRAKEQASERGYVNHALGKTKQVAFASSHCGIFRDKYVVELQKYISVTVFGKCSYRYKKSGDCERGSAACAALMRQFKFYLAFESSFCHDYVTEKYWENSLMTGLVPVVMGANYDHLNSIPGSYIDVSDFPSIKALADYLLYLDKNDTAYNEYFKWKQSYTVVHNDMFCKLCQELHNENHPKRNVYDDLEAFWSKEEQCGKFNDKEVQLVQQVRKSSTSLEDMF